MELDPKFAMAHNNLGNGLREQGKLQEAVAEYRQAIALDPKLALAHNNLGTALHQQGKRDEALAECREALALDPKLAVAHCNLGKALREQGQFAAALASFRRGHELGSKSPRWNVPSADLVREAERLAALDILLAKVLKREAVVHDAAVLMELARFATHEKKMFAAASGLCQETFRAHPDWAEAEVPPQPVGLRFSTRRFAVAAASMAAAGEGDGAGLTPERRAAWRRQALDWLRAELGVWRQRLDGATSEERAEIGRLIANVQQDSWLASIRDTAQFDRLPTEERDAWHKLWAEVAALLKKAGEATKK
jgi:tetratricopeptide (TPR) repeat protein